MHIPVRRTAEKHNSGQAQGHHERRARSRGCPEKETRGQDRHSRSDREDGRQAYAGVPQVRGAKLGREKTLLA